MDKYDVFDSQVAFEPLPTDAFNSDEIVRPSMSYAKNVWINFKRRKTAWISFIILIVLIIMSIIGPMISNYDPITNDLAHAHEKPSQEHWFGTDALGRDLWTRVWCGGRVSLFIALASTILPTLIGMFLGGLCGYLGGWVDIIICRITEVLQGVPSMIYNILLILVFNGGSMWTLLIAFTLTGWFGGVSGTRGLVLQMRSRDYVMASEALGASTTRIIWKHLIPNILGIQLVGISMSIPNAILGEAFLSYIGLGITPPTPSWGQLIKASADNFRYYPHEFLFPCACVSLVVLSFNLIGDGLRDALDPRIHT